MAEAKMGGCGLRATPNARRNPLRHPVDVPLDFPRFGYCARLVLSEGHDREGS